MLSLKNITKVFPGVVALDHVSIEFNSGEIHALLGENGAGKSTLIKIICGIYQPTQGEIQIEGNKVKFKSFRDAVEHSVSIVNQEIQVIPLSSIAENIMLDKLNKYTTRGLVDWKKMRQDAKKYMDMVGLDLPPEMEISMLSAAQKQMVQIAKALAAESKILLLDEPTSSLTQGETEVLFSLMDKLKKKGVALIFVSHKLEEVLEVCDKVTVLRDGQYIGTREIQGLTKKDIIQMMIGRSTNEKYMGALSPDYHQVVLKAEDVTQYGKIHHANFELHKGEILGFYGLVGSGRTELAKVLLGEEKADGGTVYVNGQKATIHSMFEALHKYNIGYVSENRKEEGLILNESIKSNIGTTTWRKIARRGIIPMAKEKEQAQEIIQMFQVKTTGMNQEVNDLSGGNQQKVSIGKWLAAGCDILIIDEPTVGVDVGAKEAIHEIIWKLVKEQGKSVILISSDMPELIKLSRRILVFKENEIVAEIGDMNDREHGYQEVSALIGEHLA